MGALVPQSTKFASESTPPALSRAPQTEDYIKDYNPYNSVPGEKQTAKEKGRGELLDWRLTPEKLSETQGGEVSIIFRQVQRRT